MSLILGKNWLSQVKHWQQSGRTGALSTGNYEAPFLDVLDAFRAGCQAVGTAEVDGEVAGEVVGTPEGAARDVQE